MNGAERRTCLLETLTSAASAISGGDLAKSLGVSRQIIVQDIALLRAENKNVLSTNKGYLLFQPTQYDGAFRRVFHVCHSTDQLLDELTTIVELGGHIQDVSVDHALYGQICCDLIINTLHDAQEFARKLSCGSGNPLKILTDDQHYHTVIATSDALLDVIESALLKKGYLVDQV